MIVRINTGSNVGGAVRYNEDKITNGEAHVINILNFPARNPEALSVQSRIKFLELQANQNPNISKPTVHIALAFHPSEGGKMTDDKLNEIAGEYMDSMGFGNQPMVIYRHEDTNHPHIHIVTVSVDDDGKKINMQNDQYRSNAIRKELEIKYDLIKAEEQSSILTFDYKLPENGIDYGKGEAKKAIGNILQTAMKDYSFSSINEFNSFLGNYGVQMNVIKGKGEQNWKGLTFQLTDGENPRSPQIKASSYHFAPSLEKLEARFRQGEKQKSVRLEAFKSRVFNHIREYYNMTEADFKNGLREKGIQVIDTGKTYVYVDHQKRDVYGENDMGALMTRRSIASGFGSISIKRSDYPQPEKAPPRNQKTGTVETVITAGQVIKEIVAGPTPKATVPVEKAPTEAEKKEAGILISRDYQAYKKQEGIYLESTLIRAFPFQHLVDQMLRKGYTQARATAFVGDFADHKQKGLPDIIARQGENFNRLARAYLNLVSQMPLVVEGRLKLLKSMGLDYLKQPTGESVLVNPREKSLTYDIPRAELGKLLTAPADPHPYVLEVTGAEIAIYQAAASNRVPKDIGPEQVRTRLLRTLLPAPIFETLSQGLNQTGLQRLEATELKDVDRVAYYFRRGMVINSDEGVFRSGFYTTPASSFKPLGGTLQPFLKREGFTADYERQVDTLNTPLGHLLVMYTQGLDTNSEAKQKHVVNKLNEHYPELGALSGWTLIEAMEGELRNQKMTPLTGQQQPGPKTKPGISISVTRQKSPEQQRIDKLIWSDYGKFRMKNGYSFESTLLSQPKQFPISRLTALLMEKEKMPADIALQQAESFRNYRLNEYNKVRENDEARFKKGAVGYVAMLATAPIAVKDRIGVLKALYLTLQQTPDGNYAVVNPNDPSLRHILTEQEAKGIHTEPQKLERIDVPTKDFPRQEQKLLERVALGEDLSKNPEDKDPVTFRAISGERARTLLTPGQWQGVSGWLNENTVKALLVDAPANGAEKLHWLYQRGLVVVPVEEGKSYRIGHCLTKPEQFIEASPGLRAVIDEQGGKFMNESQQQYAALLTERGKLMRNLAGAIDSGDPNQITREVGQIVTKARELEPLKSDPEALLEKLSRTSGPVVEKAVRESREERTESVFDPLENTPNNQDNLGEAFKGMDTNQVGKKKKQLKPENKPQKIKR